MQILVKATCKYSHSVTIVTQILWYSVSPSRKWICWKKWFLNVLTTLTCNHPKYHKLFCFIKMLTQIMFHSKWNTQESDNICWWPIALRESRPQVEREWSNANIYILNANKWLTGFSTIRIVITKLKTKTKNLLPIKSLL